jgi:hypothetical protein
LRVPPPALTDRAEGACSLSDLIHWINAGEGTRPEANLLQVS